MKNKNLNIEEINAAYGKSPPQAVEVEEAVLGALMLERDAFETVSRILKTESFYKDTHQIIFETIQALHKKKIPIDLLAVTQELKDRNLLDEIEGPGYITQLTRRVASAAHIEYHARIISQKYQLRKIINSTHEIQNKAYSDMDVDIVLSELKSVINSIEDNYIVADSGTHIKKVLKDTLEQIQEDNLRIEENQSPGIPTGFTSMDYNTGGWRNGNLIVLAARPSVGKTSLDLYFTLTAAKAGYWVNIFSLEMLKEDLARILIAAEGNAGRSNVRDGSLNQNGWNEVNKAVGRLEKLPIIIKDSSGMNISHIDAAIRANCKKNMCNFVIIDYLQLVKSFDKKNIREQEIAEISRTLKNIALTNNIPVMALSQLNRIDASEEPGLINLRESGAIEQDADLVCFLYRPTDNEDSISLSIAKHRRGKMDKMKIYHNGEMTQFSEIPFNNESLTSDNLEKTKNTF